LTLAGETSFCVYDAPSPEAIRRAAARNGLPVGRITEVRVLDPYFHDASGARRRSGDASSANDPDEARAG